MYLKWYLKVHCIHGLFVCLFSSKRWFKKKKCSLDGTTSATRAKKFWHLYFWEGNSFKLWLFQPNFYPKKVAFGRLSAYIPNAVENANPAACRWAVHLWLTIQFALPNLRRAVDWVKLRVSEHRHVLTDSSGLTLREAHSLTPSLLLTHSLESSRIPLIHVGSSRSHTCHIPPQSCTSATRAGREIENNAKGLGWHRRFWTFRWRQKVSIGDNSSSPERKMDRVSHREPQTV